VRWRAIQREALCVAAYAALSAVATYPLILRLRSAIPGSGDAYQFYWNLWWVKRALLERHATPYLIDDVFFPYGAHLYFHTLNLLPGVIALPVTVAAGLPAAYNGLVFLAFALSGYGMYRLTLYVLEHDAAADGGRDRRAARLAAFVAGAAFTFCSYRFVHLLGHLDLLSTQWLPLFVLSLLKTQREPGWRNAVACGGLFAATFLTSSYYALFLLVFTALVAGHIVVRRDAGWRAPLMRVGAAMAIGAVILSPLLASMLTLGRVEGRTANPAYDVDRFSADLLAFVVPSPLHPVVGGLVAPAYRVMARNGSSLEAVMFLGFVPLVLAAVAIGRDRPRRWAFWITGTALFVALALGPVMHVAGRIAGGPLSSLMPYRLLAIVPYGDIPRVPARFVVMAQLCLSVAAGIGAFALLRRIAMARAPGVATALTAAILLENAVTPLPLTDVQVPAYFERLAPETGRGGILEVPIPDDPSVFPRRMLWQTVHQQPVFGGYLSRSLPPLAFDAVPGFAQLKTLSGSLDDVVSYDAGQLPAISRAILSAYGAARIVVETRLMPPADGLRARTILDSLLGPSARDYEDADIISYAVPRASPPAAAMWLDTGWSYVERLPGHDRDARPLRWRWMGDRARFGVMAAEPAQVRLRLIAQALGPSRRLRVQLGGMEIVTLSITDHRATYETPAFHMPSGAAFVDVTSLDGAASPGADPRRLSVALYAAELVNADAQKP
jgi:hypothetical protein